MPDPYELAPEPITPDLPGEVVLSESEEELIDAAASDLFLQAATCVRTFGDFHLAITGGRVQEHLCMRLMVDPKFRSLPWTRTQLWVATQGALPDEPAGTEIIDEVLRDFAGIPRSQIHLVPTGQAAHEDYERQILESLGWRERGHDRLDFVLASLDSDGSVAGIGTGEDLAGGRIVTTYHGGARGHRVAMTPWFVSGTRFLALLASGRAARPHIARLASSAADRRAFNDLIPLNGVRRWYLDRAAAGL
ncbi:MAG: 6-phosphogluconolactonase [Phycisphaerales bacterium]|nr:6-phosphogluconolactonase [Phycisphaerales bacterium]